MNEKVRELAKKVEQRLAGRFAEIDEVAALNTEKVMDSFRKHRVSDSMFAGTIEENLRLTKPDATEEELDHVLRVACAYDFVQELPGKLRHRVGGRGKGLSEGQAQRLAVARALLRGAPILLLDEATSALDEATEERMLHNLMESRLVHTCLFVTHRPGTMRFCTRQYCVHDGEVVLEPREVP